jgi:CheY-like chemotaxis protein
MVAITGYGQAEDKRCSNEAGINHHFTKPIDLDTLQELLTAGLQEKNSNR